MMKNSLDYKSNTFKNSLKLICEKVKKNQRSGNAFQFTLDNCNHTFAVERKPRPSFLSKLEAVYVVK